MDNQIVDRYLARRDELWPRIAAFQRGEQPYLILQPGPMTIYSNCNTVEAMWQASSFDFATQMEYASDFLPYLEPWLGTGVYANAFGCEYLWRDGDSPAVHYRYRTLSEVDNIPAPHIDDSPIMQRVLAAIAYYREQMHDQLPIALTDTQSANDTATLVLDACEVLAGCYEDPEKVHALLAKINRLIIDFSARQIAAIGTAPLARPGHIMASDTRMRGISISDDNLAVVSAEVGRNFCLKYDQELADAFGGLAIHSCGRWQHLMPDVASMRNVVQVDCAIDRDQDPNPNDPEAVRDAFAGSGIAVKVRGKSGADPLIATLPRLVHPELRLILVLAGASCAEESHLFYEKTAQALDALYG